MLTTLAARNKAAPKKRPVSPLRLDPTRTATLRRIFEGEMSRRFLALKQEIRNLVIDEDAFGLTVNLTPEQEERKKEKSGFSKWGFLAAAGMVDQFNRWLAQKIQYYILFPVQEFGRDWWRKYVKKAYDQGQTRSFNEVKRPELAIGDEKFPIPQGRRDFFQGTREQFIGDSFNRIVEERKVELLSQRVLTDLKGVTEAMSAQMSRVLVDGLIQRARPQTIAENLLRVVMAIGIVRALKIARTEIVRAHAEGQLDAMERLGVIQVGALVEWTTARDERVCRFCKALDGQVMSIDSARGRIPLHVSCRCAWQIVEMTIP